MFLEALVTPKEKTPRQNRSQDRRMKWWTLSGSSEATTRAVDCRTLDLPSPNAFVSLAEGAAMDTVTRESTMSGAGILLTYSDGRRVLSLSSVNASAVAGTVEVLKVNLPEPGLLWPSVFQALEPPLWHILLSTVSGLVYRIVLDDLAQHQGAQLFSHQLPSISIPFNLCHVVDLDTLVLASGDNRLLQLECPRDFQEEIHTEGAFSFAALVSRFIEILGSHRTPSK